MSLAFFRRYLEPADRLNEILFGLIMVLTFTLTAGLVGLLFATGYAWGRHAHAGAWRSGFAFLIIGSALVATAIALGG